ncbi:MAG: hypothetical protein GF349_04245 [Candidatus Magasanikbacteria bacterium]|nr:hypothetical protein [Candidatus Magasanikbacteria bacterium]
MQQFVVPQFIDVEDKILGPITTRQFLILLVAGIIIFLAYRFGDFWVFVSTLAIVGGLALIFSFVKINGQPFHYFILNILQTARKPGLRIWNKSYTKDELEFLRKAGTEKVAPSPKEAKKAGRRHIRDLSLIVNTGGYYSGANGLQRENNKMPNNLPK